MCGIAGLLSTADADLLSGHGAAMAATLDHRGPDDRGLWTDAQQGVALGHTRLAIVDLSASGHQPMPSAGGRYVIVFNGEIYNHLALRDRLAGVAWRGHSDTETILAACELWGIQTAVERCHGMFAMAVWDRHERCLTLARDRMGEKPLYWGWQGQGRDRAFLFASELKAIKAHPAFVGDIDRRALTSLLRHNYVPAPYSIYKGIEKLRPGTILRVSLADPKPTFTTYWSTAAVAHAGLASPLKASPAEVVDEVERVLGAAVRRQMMADVPLGAFLSGGIDSSTIVALMQAQSTRPIKTFTIGFHEAAYNEAPFAMDVARHLGTDHTELYVTPEQALAVIPRLPTLYDEPFSDSSQIPTFLVSQLARRHVTVSLSGDAGDELFAGYDRYRLTRAVWSKLSRVPMPLRRLAARGIQAMRPGVWDGVGRVLGGALPDRLRGQPLGDKLHKASAVFGADSELSLYLAMVSHWHDPAAVVIGGEEPPTGLTGLRPDLQGMSDIEQMMLLDTITYLPDDILVKVDRAAMGVSLETRVPFLDPEVVALAWRLPMDCKLRGDVSKWALRQVLYKHVPKTLIERPKMGFGVPIDHWLRGPLRDWAEALLDPARLARDGFFHAEPIRRKWAQHLSGEQNWQYYLWDILMFQAWHDENLGP